MLSYTFENVFILTVFQLLVSGLILCASGAVLYSQKDPTVRKVLTLVTAAFCLYSLHFLLRATFSYRSLSLPAPAVLSAQWEFLIQAIEKAGLVLLGFSYLVYKFPEMFRDWFWVIAGSVFIFLVGGPYLAGSFWPAEFPGAAASAFVNGVWLAGVAALHLWSTGRKGLLAGASLLVLAAAQFLRAASRGTGIGLSLWSSENAAVLIGLGLFVLVMESRSTHLPVRFFLRLNLIFIAVASMLILTVAEMERREYLRIAEDHTEDLSEYLRGHVIYFYNQGIEPKEILSNPEIVRKVTSDFGRLPDLRRVRVAFRGWAMEMRIEEDYVVTQEIYPAAQQAPRRRWLDDQGRMATLTPVPIEHDGTVAGSIELDESLRTINVQVARHMRVIFLTFTVGVFVAAGLFGFTVQRAHKTIQRQFGELEKTHSHLAHVERLASVGQLAGGVAHEINNPTGIILATSDHLLREIEKRGVPDGLQEDLQAIRRQARRVSEIVNGMLTFSRPTMLHKQSIDINTVLQQSLLLLVPRFREQHVRVEQKLTPGLPGISADPDRLEQVFVNLLNNAADAMANGGRINVETSKCQKKGTSCVVVAVADTGSGISEEHLKSIFDPFFSTKPKGRGTGLGLSVSHGIIRDRDGRIEVESQVGRGTTFRIYLPLEGKRLEQV